MGQSQSALDQRQVQQLREFSDNQIEAETALGNLQFAQRRAIELAEARERLPWEIMGATTVTVILLLAGSAFKRKDLVVPISGLIMAAGYRYDAAYGSNQNNIRDAADKLLQQEPARFQRIGPSLNLSQIDNFISQGR